MSQELGQVRRVSVVDELVEQMTRRILSGEWPPGTLVPSLRATAAEAGVSMLSVREAVRALQARGLVETRHGVGTFVRGQSGDEGVPEWMLGAGEVDEYVELVEARSYIETAIVELATRRRSASDLHRLDEILARMRTARQDSAAFIEADADFHLTLAEAAHNRVLMRSMLGIRLPMQRLMANRIIAHLEQFGDLDGPVSDHETIVDAVRRRDAAPGADAMQLINRRGMEHLQNLRSTSQ